PLDEEAKPSAEDDVNEEAASGRALLDNDLVTSSDVLVSRKGSSIKGGSSKRSLVEEELHDPEVEAIRRKVAQRAQYNPLRPPNYVPPSQGPPWGLLALLGGVAIVILIVVLVIANL